MDETLENYFRDGQTWDQEIVANALLSRNRAWLMAAFCMSVSLLCLAALVLLLPLKTFAPYVVSIDRATGYLEVTKELQSGALSEDEAITQSNLVRYVTAREAYNPAVLRENYEFVALLSAKGALEEYRALWDGKNPNNPSIKLGKEASIDIRIKSVAFLNERTASVRFLREQRQNGQLRTSHWNAILEFHYVQKPMRMAERFSNPLGFQIVNYRVNPEGLETIE